MQQQTHALEQKPLLPLALRLESIAASLGALSHTVDASAWEQLSQVRHDILSIAWNMAALTPPMASMRASHDK